MCQSLLKIGTLLHKLGFVKTGVASTVNFKGDKNTFSQRAAAAPTTITNANLGEEKTCYIRTLQFHHLLPKQFCAPRM